MEIHLLRHGIAYDLGEAGAMTDEARALTPEGKAKMVAEAEGMRVLGLEFDRILTSPLVRARQTAGIVADVLKCADRLVEFGPLSPGTPPDRLFTELEPFARLRSILLVGHEPGISRTATRLLGGSGLSVFAFKKGALCCIDASVPPRTPGVLRWHLTPAQLRLIGEQGGK